MLFNVILAVDDLVEFKNDESSNKSRCGGNSRNDLSGNELRLMTVGLLNLVILSSQITCCSDEIDMVICIVIFLEFDWRKLETC
jgi:hypothetical protein